MEKKYYQIRTKTPEDWKVVHELLMQDGTLEDNIPCHSVECANDIKHSETRSTYLMTDEEAELLRSNDRIYSVGLDPVYHPEIYIPPEPFIKKHGRSVRNYRSLRKFDPTTGYTYGPPRSRTDSRLSGEYYRTGYQILRCTSEKNPFSLDSSEVKNQDIDYSTDGTDVDVIVVDNGTFFGHPEFCYDAFSPPNYVRGNVLSRHGICGVLDLILDAPYYLDPEWFDADPTNRLERRWDGTIVPKEKVAIQWWYNYRFRSSSFPNFGSIVVRGDYSRELHCGKDQKTQPSNSSRGDHGTPCASLVYGKNFGWAFNSNKWSVSANLAGNPEGESLITIYDVTKIFHRYKPYNPKFGTKNPTVSSNSYGSVLTIPTSAKYSYRGGSETDYEFSYSKVAPNFLKTSTSIFSPPQIPGYYDPILNSTFLAPGEEMVDAGVIFVCAAGNDGRYIGTPTDEDYNNYTITSGNKVWTNRPGWPAQIGEKRGTTDRYHTIIVGAIDDEYTGRYGGTGNLVFDSQPSGKETTARNGETSSSDYSNKGSAIDFYAPGDGTLAASNGSDFYPNPYQPFSDFTYYDRYFNGTSSATPVTAGVIACFAQNNRDLNAFELKTYMRNAISLQTDSQFFIGPRPGNDPNDSAWIVPFSVMGRGVKIIKEVTSRNVTPNATFTPTYGISSGSGANERFVITESSGLTHKIEIYGIKNFEETPATYELNIKTGYYKVGSTSQDLSQVNLRIDPTNPKKLQLTDSDGIYGWDDMEITVTNGEFIKSSTEIYYKFSGGTLPTSTAYSPSSATPSGPYTPPAPGGGAITGGGDLIVTDWIVAGDDIIGLASDERLKDNIKPIENAIEKLEQLEGFTYNFNEIGEKLGFDPDKRHAGVSAQDVKNVLPEASAPAPKDNNYLTVKYDKLIPLLIESIKDLKNDIDDIKKNDGK